MSENKKILIIEDDKATIDAISIKLEDLGFVVSKASDGQEGLNSIKANKPDLVVLDLMMPVMGGIETLKNIRANEETKDLPVVILTNTDSEDKIAEAMVNNSSDYLIKTDHTLESIVDFITKKLEK